VEYHPHADLASGEIVEDMKLGLELARAGHAPYFLSIGPFVQRVSIVINRRPGLNVNAGTWTYSHHSFFGAQIPVSSDQRPQLKFACQ